MAKKETLDPRSLGIGSLMEAHIKKERSKEEQEKEMRDLYSIAGRELLASGKTKDQRVKGGHEKARRLAETQAPQKQVVSTLHLRSKAAAGKNPTWKHFASELAAANPNTDWEAYDVNGWWKKLNKGEKLL
jgi:hypothetical protein